MLRSNVFILVGIILSVICKRTVEAAQVRNIEVSKGDINLGGYFGVHSFKSSSECGPIDPESGIYLTEAMKYAINEANKHNKTLFFGAKLGYTIADTCFSPKHMIKELPWMVQWDIVGVLGPPTSDEAVFLSSALNPITKTLISHSATSMDLADRSKYSNFYRSVPGDDFQIQILLDILKHFKWTYISTVNSYGNFGQRGMDKLLSNLASLGICVATRNILPQSATEHDYNNVARKLSASKATTVVLFTTPEDTRGVIKATKGVKKFTWLSSTAWAVDSRIVRGIEKEAKGAILLNYAGMDNIAYRKHFMGLKLRNDSQRWFREFWEYSFNCSLNPVTSKKPCSGNESLADSNFFGKFAPANAVIESVRAFSCAIHHAMNVFCDHLKLSESNCTYEKVKYLIKTYLAYFVKHISYYIKPGFPCHIYDPIKFDNNGSYYRDVELINFDGEQYRTIGRWSRNSNNGTARFTHVNITWFDGRTDPPLSICSLPCKLGQIRLRSKLNNCCHTCRSCAENDYVSNNTCVSCHTLEVPNARKTACNKLPIINVGYENSSAIIALLQSMLGIALNTFVLVLFIKKRDSRIVKASSRELCFLILTGLYVCFISPILSFLQPDTVLCTIRKFIFAVSLTICYSPLMLKTNRIYRIFEAAKYGVNMPQLVSAQAQILICLTLLAIHLLVCTAWGWSFPDQISYVVDRNSATAIEFCQSDPYVVMINLTPCLLMMSISTFYAFKTRHFPKNYNEAWSIGITMYLSCFLWAIFIPLLFLVSEGNNVLTKENVLAHFTNLIGLVSLLGLFGPKVRRLLFPSRDGEKVWFSSAKSEYEVERVWGLTIDGSNENISDGKYQDMGSVTTLLEEDAEKKNGYSMQEDDNKRRKSI